MLPTLLLSIIYVFIVRSNFFEWNWYMNWVSSRKIYYLFQSGGPGGLDSVHAHGSYGVMRIRKDQISLLLTIIFVVRYIAHMSGNCTAKLKWKLNHNIIVMMCSVITPFTTVQKLIFVFLMSLDFFHMHQVQRVLGADRCT